MIKGSLEGLNQVGEVYIKFILMAYDEVDVDVVLAKHIFDLNRIVGWHGFAHRVGTSIAVFHTLKTASNPLNMNLIYTSPVMW